MLTSAALSVVPAAVKTEAAGLPRQSPISSPPALTSLGQSFREVLAHAHEAQRSVDLLVGRLQHGGPLSPAQLLSLQTQVYQVSQQAELLSHTVNRVGDTIRDITQLRA